MWMSTNEEKEEIKRAEGNLRRMKEVEARYKAERVKVVEPTAFGGIRIKYVEQNKAKNYGSKLV